MKETWKALEELAKEGKIRSLGVSNFDRELLESFKKFLSRPLATLESKLSPYRPGQMFNKEAYDIINYCQDEGILFVGYSVLNPWPGRHSLIDDPLMHHIADAHRRTIPQTLYRWVLQLGAAVSLRSQVKSRIEEDTRLFDFELNYHEMAWIGGLHWLVHERTSRPFFPEVFGADPISASPPGEVIVRFRNDLARDQELTFLSQEGFKLPAGMVPNGGELTLSSHTGHVFGFWDPSSGDQLRSAPVAVREGSGGPAHEVWLSSFSRWGLPDLWMSDDLRGEL